MFKNAFMIAKGPLRVLLITMELMLGLSIGNPLFCQDPERKRNSADFNETSEFAGFKIPALGQLIDSALIHSPLLDEQQALIKIRELQQKSASNEWARYILFFSEYRYGSINILIADGVPINYGQNSNSTWYNVGARFQLTIFDMLDLRRKNKIAATQIDYEKSKESELKRMIQDDVIRLWNKLVAFKEIVAINEDHIAAQESNIFYAEQQFKAGDIPLIEYSRIKEISIRARQEYQLAKKEFRETYLLLESLIGVKLSEMNPNHK